MAAFSACKSGKPALKWPIEVKNKNGHRKRCRVGGGIGRDYAVSSAAKHLKLDAGCRREPIFQHDADRKRFVSVWRDAYE
jgi:hypothetical protein